MKAISACKEKIKRFIEWFDPWHQSFFYLPWNFWSILLMVGLDVWLVSHKSSNLASHLYFVIFSVGMGVENFFVYGTKTFLYLIIFFVTLFGKFVWMGSNRTVDHFFVELDDTINYMNSLYSADSVFLFCCRLMWIVILLLLYRRALHRNGGQLFGAPFLFVLSSCCLWWSINASSPIVKMLLIALSGFFLFVILWSVWDSFWHSEEHLEENMKRHEEI